MSMLGKTLLAGVAVAAGVVLVRKRGTVKGLLPGRSSSEPAPAPPPPAQSPPPISNYDAAGPVENTSTPVPTPPPFQPPAIDEAAEEAAAAAEAANIGGTVSDYAGVEYGETADESMRPLMEAGEGEAEGQEQAEAELAAAAEPTAPGLSPEGHQIEDAIEAAGNPTTPEHVEPLVSGPQPGDAEQRAHEPGGTDAGASGGAGGPGGAESAEKAAEEGSDSGSEWRTWSGRSVNP
jgi:hypothetical protein